MSITTDRHPELETIAAFLDGSVSAEERREMEAHLAVCERCAELVAEVHELAADPNVAGSVKAELEAAVESAPRLRARATDEATTTSPRSEPSEAGEVPELHRRPAAHGEPTEARRRPVLVPLLAAAAVVAAVAIGFWLLRSAGPDLGGEALVAELPEGEELATALPAGWIEDRGWEVLRGGSSISAPPDAAFKLGARSVDLAVALKAGDAATASKLVGFIETEVEALEGAENLLVPVFLLRQQLNVPRDDLTTAREHARSFDQALAPVEPKAAVRAGRWAAAANVATLARDGEFFASPQWRAGLELLERPSADEALGAVAGRLREAVPAEGEPDFEAIRQGLRRAFQLLGDGDASL